MSAGILRRVINNSAVARTILYPALAGRRALINKRNSIKMEVVENLSSLLHDDPIVQLEDFKGMFAVDPRSHLFSRTVLSGSYEPELLKIVAPYIDKERDAIDVGANIGFYSVLLAKTLNEGQRILSIEPTSNALRRLRRNIDMNEVGERIEIFEGVASNSDGTIEINIVVGKEEYSSVGKMKHHSIQGEKTVVEKAKSATLDALVESRSLNPGFIKVDVEGVEHLVFGGAQNVLSEYRPIVLSELSDELLRENGSSAMEVINLVEKNNYDVYDPFDMSMTPGSKLYGDILCFPKELNVNK